MRHFELEVCVDQVEDAIKASAAGATRIEFNAALDLDGLTPSADSCRWLQQNCQVSIVAMLRPHDLGFCYSKSDELKILRDCHSLLDSGVAGIVFGALDESGEIAIPLLQQVIAICGSKEVIFHRAFDCLKDQLTGLERLIECGVRRVLTSGGADSAESGIPQLAKLVESADSRIEILPGAGVNSRNAKAILDGTHATQLHGSFRTKGLGKGPDANEIKAVLEIGNPSMPR